MAFSEKPTGQLLYRSMNYGNFIVMKVFASLGIAYIYGRYILRHLSTIKDHLKT